MRGRALGFVLAVIATACDGGGPSGTSGTGVEGRYEGDHRFSVTFPGGQPTEFTCTGSVVIIDVSGTAMTGTLTIDPCPDLGTSLLITPISGTLSSSGALTFTSPAQAQLIDAVGAQGCTVTRVDPGFAGTLANRTIDASFTATVDCGTGSSPFAWRVDMTKAT